MALSASGQCTRGQPSGQPPSEVLFAPRRALHRLTSITMANVELGSPRSPVASKGVDGPVHSGLLGQEGCGVHP